MLKSVVMPIPDLRSAVRFEVMEKDSGLLSAVSSWRGGFMLPGMVSVGPNAMLKVSRANMYDVASWEPYLVDGKMHLHCVLEECA